MLKLTNTSLLGKGFMCISLSFRLGASSRCPMDLNGRIFLTLRPDENICLAILIHK